MVKNKYKGLFIDIEGLDGSGASTQAELLLEFLKKNGIKSTITKEPTNNIIGGLIRGQLTGDWKTTNTGLQLLFAADRDHHLMRDIIPALKQGGAIITDRYAFSTIAFGSLNMDRNWLEEINKYFVEPDITILLKVRPEVCIKRIEKSRFSMELFEERKKLTKIWRTYEWLSRKYKSIILLDGEESIEKIHKKIIQKIQSLLKRKYKK